MITDVSADDLCLSSTANWCTVKGVYTDELIAWALLAPCVFKSNMGVFYWREPVHENTHPSIVIRDAPLLRPVNGAEQWIQSVKISNTYQLHVSAWERLQKWMN